VARFFYILGAVVSRPNRERFIVYGVAVPLLMIATAAAAQPGSTQTAVLQLPNGPSKQIPSPDGSSILFGVPDPSGGNLGPSLWIENTRTRQRTMLLSIVSAVTAAWSSDGSAFYVEDHRTSDSTLFYLYDATTLERLNVSDRIQAADPEAREFSTNHAYFVLDRWEGTRNLIVRLFGHTDHEPVMCFDLRYRVSRDGIVERLSRRVWPVAAKGCEE
jgi:hypothetical protein